MFKLQLNFCVYANSKSIVQLHEVLEMKCIISIWIWMKPELHILLCLYGILSAPTSIHCRWQIHAIFMATILLVAGSSGCRLHVLSPHNMLQPDQSIFVFVSISPRQEYQQVSVIMVSLLLWKTSVIFAMFHSHRPLKNIWKENIVTCDSIKVEDA